MWMPAERATAHAEQVERAAIGQRPQLEPPAALGIFTGETQRVPAQRVLPAERQPGHEVHLRVEQVRAGLATVEVRRSPAPLSRLLRRRVSGSMRPPKRVLRFRLTKDASFRGFWSAPSHHLGVDAFLGADELVGTVTAPR